MSPVLRVFLSVTANLALVQSQALRGGIMLAFIYTYKMQVGYRAQLKCFYRHYCANDMEMRIWMVLMCTKSQTYYTRQPSFARTTVIQEMRGTHEEKMKLKHNRSRKDKMRLYLG